MHTVCRLRKLSTQDSLKTSEYFLDRYHVRLHTVRIRITADSFHAIVTARADLGLPEAH